MDANISDGKIWAIYDLVLNSPSMYDYTLKTPYIENVDPGNILRLETVIKKLKLNS